MRPFVNIIVFMIVFGAILLFAAVEAAAQTCRGTAPIDSAAPYQVGGSLSFSENASVYSATFAGGVESFFGTIQAGRVRFDAFDESAAVLGGTAGLQIPADAERRIVICPTIRIAREFGPNDLGGTGLDVSRRQLGAGASAGVAAAQRGPVTVVPLAGVAVTRVRTSVNFAGVTTRTSDTVGQITLGLGIVAHRRLSVVPAAAIPFGVEDAASAFLLTVAVSLP